MKDKLLEKGIIFLILILLLINVNFQTSGEITSNSYEDTLYVGCDEFECYDTIQSAINDAKNGDTVFVYDDSSPYYENIIVNKSIILIGENRGTTVIDGGGYGDVITVIKDQVNISQFTIQNGGTSSSGITIINNSNNNNISENTITSNKWDGISLFNSSYNLIKGNVISNNSDGLYISYLCNNNTIIENKFLRNSFYGIYIQASNDNNIFYFNNLIENAQNSHDESNNIWHNERMGNYWDNYEDRYPDSRKIWLMGVWSVSYSLPGGNNQDMYPLFKPYSESNKQVVIMMHFPYINQVIKQFLTSEQTFRSTDGYLKTFK